MLRVIIVDDEQPAREDLRERLNEEHGIEIVAECSNALEAIPAIQRLLSTTDEK